MPAQRPVAAPDPALNPGTRGTVLDAIRASAHDRPAHPAVVTIAPGRPVATLSYADLLGKIERVARGLDERRTPTRRMVLACTNGPEFVSTLLAALHRGHEVLTVSPAAGADEAARAAAAIGADLIVSDSTQGRVPAVHPAALELHGPPRLQPRPGNVLLQSSGSTGMPRIVRRTARALDSVALAVRHAARLSPLDAVLAAVPMSHSYGLENGLLAPLLAGATIVAVSELSPGAVEIALDHGVTVLPGVPFLFESLAARSGAAGPGALRLAYSAGGPLPRSVAESFEQARSIRPGQLYGATEVGSATFEDPGLASFAFDRVGAPLLGVSVVVSHPEDPTVPIPHGAEGHVLVRAESMLDSFLDGPADLVNGYFPTGDLGTVDAHSRLTITGRLKLMIDVGGVKVNPLEVERVLAASPGVRECVVVALPVSAAVSRLRAVIVPEQMSAPPPERDLRAFAREHLAPYKVPRVFEFVERLPKSPTGKILRRTVEETRQ